VIARVHDATIKLFVAFVVFFDTNINLVANKHVCGHDEKSLRKILPLLQCFCACCIHKKFVALSKFYCHQ
jgi:hypothetical protein